MNKFLAVNVVVLVITTMKYVRNVPVSDIIITEIKVETLPLLQVTEIDVGQKKCECTISRDELEDAGLNRCGCDHSTQWHF